MASLIKKYEQKLIGRSLVDPGNAVMGEWDDELCWNHTHPAVEILAPLFDALNISTVLFSQPAEPYKTIIDYLSQKAKGVIRLKDNETRLFLHDLPVLETFTSECIISKLKHRKCVLIPGKGIITSGTVSPEQTFVNFSSVLFACFVKYFSDTLQDAAANRLNKKDRSTLDRVLSYLPEIPEVSDTLLTGPFESEEDVYDAVSEAGKPMVDYGLVDSVMGNISYAYNNKVYISQTGSFLDELEGCIDACPMDNSACTGITASSELPTHMAIYRSSDLISIVHGHPRFAVIMSMFCEKKANCKNADDCSTRCPENRWLDNVPIVIGESGSGPHGICHTVPAAVIKNKAAIVYGHGLFTAGKKDFNKPFHLLCAIEKRCREIYFDCLRQFHVL